MMSTKPQDLARLLSRAAVVFALVAICAACASNRHRVIAVTGTNIGIEIGGNPSTGGGKFGFQRTEVALVPTNRTSNDALSSNIRGAEESTDVLMELRMNQIFHSNAGHYQRLAVGKTAVMQPGAAFLFARDRKGEVDDNIAQALGMSFSERVDLSTTSGREISMLLGRTHTFLGELAKDTESSAREGAMELTVLMDSLGELVPDKYHYYNQSGLKPEGCDHLLARSTVSGHANRKNFRTFHIYRGHLNTSVLALENALDIDFESKCVSSNLAVNIDDELLQKWLNEAKQDQERIDLHPRVALVYQAVVSKLPSLLLIRE